MSEGGRERRIVYDTGFLKFPLTGAVDSALLQERRKGARKGLKGEMCMYMRDHLNQCARVWGRRAMSNLKRTIKTLLCLFLLHLQDNSLLSLCGSFFRVSIAPSSFLPSLLGYSFCIASLLLVTQPSRYRRIPRCARTLPFWFSFSCAHYY